MVIVYNLIMNIITNAITYTLSTGNTLVIERTATYGDILIGGCVLILALVAFFQGIIWLSRPAGIRIDD